MNNGLLAKMVVIVVVLAGYMVWRATERHQHVGCDVNCPTDFSAAKRR